MQQYYSTLKDWNKGNLPLNSNICTILFKTVFLSSKHSWLELLYFLGVLKFGCITAWFWQGDCWRKVEGVWGQYVVTAANSVGWMSGYLQKFVWRSSQMLKLLRMYSKSEFVPAIWMIMCHVRVLRPWLYFFCHNFIVQQTSTNMRQILSSKSQHNRVDNRLPLSTVRIWSTFYLGIPGKSTDFLFIDNFGSHFCFSLVLADKHAMQAVPRIPLRNVRSPQRNSQPVVPLQYKALARFSNSRML